MWPNSYVGRPCSSLCLIFKHMSNLFQAFILKHIQMACSVGFQFSFLLRFVVHISFNNHPSGNVSLKECIVCFYRLLDNSTVQGGGGAFFGFLDLLLSTHINGHKICENPRGFVVSTVLLEIRTKERVFDVKYVCYLIKLGI